MEFSRTGEFGSQFLNWLQNEKGLKERSACDVLSHLSRSSKFINIFKSGLDGDDLAYLLGKNKEFSELSATVKSHLRRSVRLFIEFQAIYSKDISPELF